MSIVLAFISALLIILFSVLAKKKPRWARVGVIVPRYYHPAHTWMRPTDDGDVLVGIDDFAQSVVGSVDEVKLPRILRRVRQGEPALTIQHGNRCVPMVSPVTGWVIERNEMVMHNPALINVAPYGDGWLFKVHPSKLSCQLHNLFTGKRVHEWIDASRARLAQFFAGTPGLRYQDGGLIVRDLADKCSDVEWNALVQEFFLAGSNSVRQPPSGT
jgi:glycine cleavage system H protein